MAGALMVPAFGLQSADPNARSNSGAAATTGTNPQGSSGSATSPGSATDMTSTVGTTADQNQNRGDHSFNFGWLGLVGLAGLLGLRHRPSYGGTTTRTGDFRDTNIR